MQEIVVSRGKILELLRPDANTGKVHTLLTMEVFGIIRSLMAFRLTGGTKGRGRGWGRGLGSRHRRHHAGLTGVCVCVCADYIVIGSDSGRIVILEYNPSKNMFEKIHQETFGKSGCRRIVPGQFLAVDPKGRAVMIGEGWARASGSGVRWRPTAVPFPPPRSHREAEAGVHPEQGRRRQADHLLAAGGAQGQHAGLPRGGRGRGL